MIERVIDEAKKGGFHSADALHVKEESHEFWWTPSAEQNHLRLQDLLFIRGFWESGLPAACCLTSPTDSLVRQGLLDLRQGGLPDQSLSFARRLPRTLQKIRMHIYDESAAKLGPADFSRLVDRLFESALFHQGCDIRSVRLLQQQRKVYIGNSLGLSGKYRKTLFTLTLVLGLGGEWITLTDSQVYWDDFDPLHLVTRGVNLLRSLKGEPFQGHGDVPLVFSPESAAMMLRQFAHRFRLPDYHRHCTWQEEDQAVIFPQLFRLEDEPQLDRQPGSVPFDDEGVQCRLTRLVDRGRIVHRIGDIRRGELWKSGSTGNGFRRGHAVFPGVHFSNLSIPAGVYSFRRLMADAEGGVMVTMLWPVSAQAGQSACQAFGFQISGGDIAQPVRFILKTRFPDFFLRLQKTSKERRFFYHGVNIGAPFLLSEGTCQEEGIHV